MNAITDRKVPFFDYPHVSTSHEEGMVSFIWGVGCRGAFIMQTNLIDFEADLTQYTGAKYAIGVATLPMGYRWH